MDMQEYEKVLDSIDSMQTQYYKHIISHIEYTTKLRTLERHEESPNSNPQEFYKKRKNRLWYEWRQCDDWSFDGWDVVIRGKEDNRGGGYEESYSFWFNHEDSRFFFDEEHRENLLAETNAKFTIMINEWFEKEKFEKEAARTKKETERYQRYLKMKEEYDHKGM